MEGVTKEVIEKIAEQSKGFSGREITKMVIAWHDAAFTLPDAVLTPDLMEKVLGKFHLQHKLKETWTMDEGKLLEKLIFAEEEAMQGSKEDVDVKDMDMVKRQEELMAKINEERLGMKHDREYKAEHHPAEHDLKADAKIINENTKKI